MHPVNTLRNAYLPHLRRFVTEQFSGVKVPGTVLRAYVRAAHEPLWQSLCEAHKYWPHPPWKWADRFDRWMRRAGLPTAYLENNKLYYKL